MATDHSQTLGSLSQLLHSGQWRSVCVNVVSSGINVCQLITNIIGVSSGTISVSVCISGTCYSCLGGVKWHHLISVCISSVTGVSLQDFGDYSESFYSVQTTEGETISQLIAGYIDIIMQKKKPLHKEIEDEDEEPVIVDYEVDPQK